MDALLGNGLTRDEALRIALINNRDLQAIFEEIGVSKSDLVQAGLFRNPTISAFFRFPFHGSGTNIEIDGGLFPLSDLWQIPFRKKVAEAHLERTMKKVEQTVLDTIRETKKAYDSVYYSRLTLTETETLLGKFIEIQKQVEKRRSFGFLKDLDVYQTQVLVKETEIVLQRVKMELALSKSHLHRLLGLGAEDINFEISLVQENPALSIPHIGQAMDWAKNQRLDIQMARLKTKEAEHKLGLEKVMVFKEVVIGASYERDVDGDAAFGPGIDIQIPIYDQNQAQIAKAEFMVRRAEKQLQAILRKVREEIVHDLERIRLQQSTIRLIEHSILPLRRNALAYADKWVGAMQLNQLYLLEAQRGMLVSQLEHTRSLLELRNAHTDLEYHLGGKLPVP
ncbi:MAG: TolC family protein [Deltaproteobacteria bacterium]|nr:TolC family protein [Deltaproteobacteria bacterium]